MLGPTLAQLLLVLSAAGCQTFGTLASPSRWPMRARLFDNLPRNLSQQRFWAAEVLTEWQRHISEIDETEFREFSTTLVTMRGDLLVLKTLFGVENFNAACHFVLLPSLIYGNNYSAVRGLANTWFEFVIKSLRGQDTNDFLLRYLQQFLRVGKSEVTYSTLLRHSGQPGQFTLSEFARRRLPDAPVPEDCRPTLLIQLTNPQQLLDNTRATVTAELQARLLNLVAPSGDACLQYNSTHKVIGFLDTIMHGNFEALRVPNRMWIDSRLSGSLPGQLSSVANLIRYGYPALLLVGTFSNLFALLFSVMVLSESCACLYFLTLSVLDLLCLWCNLLPTILSLHWDILLRQSSTAACRLLTFFEAYFAAAAAWTVAALAIAKVLSVLMPFSSKLNSRRSHRLAIGLVLLIVALFYSPLLINRRRIMLINADFFVQCWRWDFLFLDYRLEKLWLAMAFPVLPLAVILACNCALLALRQRHLRQAAVTTSSGAGTDRRQLFGSMTIVSSVFLVFTAPNTVMQLIEAANSGDINQYNVIDELSSGNGTLLNYWAHVTHFVMLLHNAFNIFAYGMSAPYLRLAFRQRLSRSIRCPGFLQRQPFYGSVLSMRTNTSSSQRSDRSSEAAGSSSSQQPAVNSDPPTSNDLQPSAASAD